MDTVLFCFVMGSHAIATNIEEMIMILYLFTLKRPPFYNKS